MNNAFMVKNLYGYERVTPVPENLPKDLTTIYLTDNAETSRQALALGWNLSPVITEFLNIEDQQGRRDAVAKINCYPELVFPEVSQYDYLFISDSNVVRMDTNYGEFVDSCKPNHTLFSTSGWYSGERNNILRELGDSISQERWKYSWAAMTENTHKYISEFVLNKIDYRNVPVASAKYIGWNLKRKAENPKIAKTFHEEYLKHLQGNIILSYLVGIYAEDVYNYTGFLNDGGVQSHNFEA